MQSSKKAACSGVMKQCFMTFGDCCGVPAAGAGRRVSGKRLREKCGETGGGYSARSTICTSCDFDTAPICVAATTPFLNSISVGADRTRQAIAVR